MKDPFKSNEPKAFTLASTPLAGEGVEAMMMNVRTGPEVLTGRARRRVMVRGKYHFRAKAVLADNGIGIDFA